MINIYININKTLMAEVIFASSYDEKNPPSNIFTSNKGECFTSTGMYPQELCIQFNTAKPIKNVNLTSYGIKSVQIQTCENDSVVNFTKQAGQSEVPNSQGLQNISLALTSSPLVKVLKIVVLEGYEDFFSIHTATFQ